MSQPCPVPNCIGEVKILQQGTMTCDGPEPHGDGTIRDYAISTLEDVEDGTEAIERRLDPLHWRQEAIRRAVHGNGGGDGLSRPKPSMLVPPPSWPSALLGIDSLRGLTVFSGKSSSGKTAAAIPSALEAAGRGWNVMYVAAEGPSVVNTRVDQWCRGRSMVAWPTRFNLLVPGIDTTLETLQAAVLDFATTNRTLVVIDSINSLVDSFVTDDDVHGIGPIKRLSMWMMAVRANTAGEVSFLVISEANANGETKGRTLDHKADMSVNFAKVDEDYSLKRVFVIKNWWGVPGPVGDFSYDVDLACLKTSAQLSAMHNAETYATPELDVADDGNPFQ